MERSVTRKVIRAAALSLLLVTATGVAGVEMFATSPAMAQTDDPGSSPALGSDPVDPSSSPAAPTTSNPGPTDGIVPGGGGGGGLPGGLDLPAVP